MFLPAIAVFSPRVIGKLRNKRNVSVLADALKHQIRCRAVPTIGDMVQAGAVGLNRYLRAEPHFSFGFAQENSDVSFDLPSYQFGGAPTGYCSTSRIEPVTSSLSSLAK